MIFFLIVKSAFIVFMVLISLAFYTLMERKVLGLVGLRFGPNKVSFIGIFQPLIDALKIVGKESNQLNSFSFNLYYLAGMMMLLSSLFLWSCIPFSSDCVDLKLNTIFFLLMLTFHTFSCLLASWSCYSKYPLISSLRVISQLISYEGVLYMLMLIFLLTYSSFSFSSSSWVNFFSFFMPLSFFVWMISVSAELSRSPFDFGESESELVSGFNLEYGSVFFSFLFMAEYSSMLFFSLATSFFFFFEWKFYFFPFLFFSFLWIRSIVPRYRFDNFLSLCWKFFLPLITSFLLIYFLLIF